MNNRTFQNKTSYKREEILERISQYVLFHGGRIAEPGLYHGRTGIALSLLLYSKRKQDKILEKCGEELLTSVINNLNCNHAISMEFGFSGIGYALALLYERGILTGDLNESLVEVDAAIMELNPLRIKDKSIRTGIGGVYVYMQKRMELSGHTTIYPNSFIRDMEHSLLYGNTPYADFRSFSLLSDLDCPVNKESDYLNQPIDLCGGCSYHLFRESYV